MRAKMPEVWTKSKVEEESKKKRTEDGKITAVNAMTLAGRDGGRDCGRVVAADVSDETATNR